MTVFLWHCLLLLVPACSVFKPFRMGSLILKKQKLKLWWSKGRCITATTRHLTPTCSEGKFWETGSFESTADTNEMSHNVRNVPSDRPPRKIQISLHIRAVWPETLLSVWRNYISLAIQNRHVQADLNLRCEHMSEGAFSDVAAQSKIGGSVFFFFFFFCFFFFVFFFLFFFFSLLQQDVQILGQI